jgi:hypothetical protein
MIGFIAQLSRLLRTLAIGLKDSEFRAMTFVAALLITSGTVFYHYTEGWRVLDSLYFSIATLTTVGYGDFVPKTDFGKAFTVVYIVGGVGVILGYLNIIADISAKSNKKNNNNMNI